MKSLQPMFDLTGKVAVVTGGHAWLGHDMAVALAEAGCSIIITSRDAKKASRIAQEIAVEYGIDGLGIGMDQCEYAQVCEMARQAYSWKDRIDILINNAGGGSGASEGNFFRRPPEAMEALIRTNLLGTLYCCQQVGQYMAEQRSGSIISIASIAGLVGRDRSMYRSTGLMEQPIDYAASKGGVIAMTRDLAAFMAPYSVRVNCISPGGFDKGNLPPAFTQVYGKATALGRMGRMGEEIMGAALYLASAASGYVTGHNLVVDGGFSIWK